MPRRVGVRCNKCPGASAAPPAQLSAARAHPWCGGELGSSAARTAEAVTTAQTAPASLRQTSCAASGSARRVIAVATVSLMAHVCTRLSLGGSERSASSRGMARSVAGLDASCLTSRLERTSKRAPLASSTGSACSRSAESRPSASRSDASRRTVCGWRQSGSSALPTGSSSSGPWLVRSSGSVARKASSCSGSSRCSSDEEQALSPIGRHSRACCLSIRAPWSIESSTDAIRKPAGRGRFSPCRSRRWHRSRAVCASPAAAPAAGGAPAPASARCAKRTMSTRSVHENTSTNRCSAESHTGRHVAPCDASAASACFMGRSASSVTTLPWVGSSSKISCCSRM
mmetsp:Transcript_4156/g.13306  ORF Transcript_4156/g.13306 Transcript_4156/m.13306 type:complete len:343 (+) Transcript_4156:250-1278(+)